MSQVDLPDDAAVSDSTAVPSATPDATDVSAKAVRGWLAEESGMVLVQSALMLLPLLIFAALATDIGAWYLQGQKLQRASDAAAMAGVVFLPDIGTAETTALELAALNGFADATPGDTNDFDTGPSPQVRVSQIGSGRLEVEIRATALSYFGKVVLDSIDIERYAQAENVTAISLGNPTSGLGTGDIPTDQLGLPSDKVWLSATAYCDGHSLGDPFGLGRYFPMRWFHRTCGSTPGTYDGRTRPNPTYDPDAYVYVVETQPGSPTVSIDVYEPGGGCGGGTGDRRDAAEIIFDIYGPSTTASHRNFVESNAPIRTVRYPMDSCISNSPTGDGWWPLAAGLPNPGAAGGYYYVKAQTPHPERFPLDEVWAGRYYNAYSLRVLRDGQGSSLCAYSAADPTCPQLYSLDWMHIIRDLPRSEASFYLAEIPEHHAGETITIRSFDSSEGTEFSMFADPSGQVMPFRWRYADTSLGGLSGTHFRETQFQQHSSTCRWRGTAGLPCLDTRDYWAFDDHFVEVEIDIPADYQCAADCWWELRYNTQNGTLDRSAWSISSSGDPVRLIQ